MMQTTINSPFALNEIGSRSNNEDTIYPNKKQATKEDTLFLVCDGVGGSEKGEIASQLVCEGFAFYFDLKPESEFEQINEDYIKGALEYSQDKIDEYLAENPNSKGMGTTLTLLSFHSQGATIAHVGDSRVYQIRNGEIIFKTSDHSFVNELVKDASIDAQMIHMSYKILEDLGISDRVDLQINTLGSSKNRADYIEALKDFFFDKVRHLSPESQARLETNPLRILDSKDEDDQILVSMAPKLKDFLDEESAKYYETVKDYLRELEIPFYENEGLVRGLDYYCDTVFEFWDRSLGAQNAIGGGGRYDGLAELLGGQHVPGVGMAMGVERIIDHMKAAGIKSPVKDTVQVFVAQLGEEGKKKALKITTNLRDKGLHSIGGMGKSSMKAQLKMADKCNAPWCIILGEIEIRDGNAILRDMRQGKQEIVKLADVEAEVISRLKTKPDLYILGE